MYMLVSAHVPNGFTDRLFTLVLLSRNCFACQMVFFTLFQDEVSAETQDFEKTFQENCYLIRLKVSAFLFFRHPDALQVERKLNDALLIVEVEPEEEDGYEVLVSYCISVDGTPTYVSTLLPVPLHAPGGL